MLFGPPSAEATLSSRTRTPRLALCAAMLGALAGAPAAGASEPLPEYDVRSPSLKVNTKGEALVQYTTTKGTRR